VTSSPSAMPDPAATSSTRAPRAGTASWHPADQASTDARPSVDPTNWDWYGRYRVITVVIDSAVIAAALATSELVALREGTPSVVSGTTVPYPLALLLIAGFWLAALAAKESRDRNVIGAGLDEYERVINASLWTFGGIAVLSYLTSAQLSRLLFLVTLPVGIAFLLTSRWLLRAALNHRRRSGTAMTPTLLVGTPDDVEQLRRAMSRRRDAGYRVVAVSVYDSSPGQSVVAPDLPQIPMNEVGAFVRASGVGAVAVCGSLPSLDVRKLAWSLEDSPTQLMFTPRLTDVAGPRIHVSDVPGLSLVHVDLPRFTGLHHVTKRAQDIVLSVIALVLFSPLLAIIALAIKFDGHGPVLFRQERVGLGGRTFVIHKFRTMRVDAESRIDELIAQAGGNALLFKLENDPRVTRVGAFLRRYSLDELPQFWTVLKGSMSIVGPRPQVAREVAEYSPALHRRLLVKPGITGLWQVNGRSSLSLEESVRLDLHYVENWSLTSDIAIIAKTVKVLVHPHGAY
jgi:exopolysaccharide biosynthesis polyprenyl glycosylphosphotransferase